MDVASALDRMGGNQGLLHRSMASFAAYAKALPQRLEQGLREADLAQVQRELHAFKGLSATMGALELAALAAQAEKQLQAQPAPDICHRVVAQLEARLVPLLPVLDEVLARLRPLALPVAPAAMQSTDQQSVNLPQWKALQLALHASDMVAMEIHAGLRQSLGDSADQTLQVLNAAMESLAFEAAAAECDRLVRQLEIGSAPD
jgi:HPt (histidine-containing phosphotransfer) domain-containing protein